MATNLLVDMRSGDIQFHRKQRQYIGWAILIMYSLLLAYRAHCHTTAGETTLPPLWELRNPRWIVGWIGALVLGALRDFAYFVPVGFGATRLVPVGSGRLRRRSINLRGLLVATALTALACVTKVVRSWYLAAVVGLAFPLSGCLFGVWAHAIWLRGWRARLRFLRKVALLVPLVVLCIGIAAWFSLEKTPLPFEAVPASSAEEQRLTRLIRSSSPRSLSEGQTHTLRLTEHDANVLLSRGLSSRSQNRKAIVRLRHDAISLLMSLPVRFGEGVPRYLNLDAAGSTRIRNGVLRLRVDRCRIGSVELPHWLLHSLDPLVTSLLNHDRQVKPFLNATKEMAIEPNSIRLTYGPMDLVTTFREKFRRPRVANEELLASTRTQVDHLLLLFAAGPLSDHPPSFNICLGTAFTLARNRSTQRDAVTENRAAILALGILLGHPGIEDFLGPVISDGNKDEAQQILACVVLHGRSDWTRHFCVSAAIAALSDEAISDACGLLKEELDTDADGSGFSFADLLVDRAGTVFGIRATRDKTAALAMQERLVGGFSIEEVCPPAGDLPEGVSEADLQAQYGGVGGAGYCRIIADIERRIAACAAYR